MHWRQLHLYVEGLDDKRLFEHIKPLFENNYRVVRIIQYKNLKKDKIIKQIQAIKENNDDYIIFHDVDVSVRPCAIVKRLEVKSNYGIPEESRIIIVIRKIESWYIAGLDSNTCEKLKIPEIECTDKLGRGNFNRLLPDKESMENFKLEIVKRFNVETACGKNKSFKYFHDKFLAPLKET